MRKIKIIFLVILTSFISVSCGRVIYLDDTILLIEEKFLELNDIDFVVDDLVLFDYLEEYPNMKITWYSNNSDYVSDEGIVTRPIDENLNVSFTAHFKTTAIYPGKVKFSLNVVASKIKINIDDNVYYVTNGKGYTLEEGLVIEGLIFKHYEDFNENVYYPGDVVLKTTKLYSIYDLKRYQVTYLDFDGSVLYSYEELYGTTAKTIEDPKRTGYHFAGWEPLVDVVRGDTVYQAEYVEITYKVYFYATKNILHRSETVLYNQKLKKPKDPEIDGGIFVGWYLDDELYDFDEVVTKDLNLKAKFDYEAKQGRK